MADSKISQLPELPAADIATGDMFTILDVSAPIAERNKRVDATAFLQVGQADPAGTASAAITAHTNAADPHPQYAGTGHTHTGLSVQPAATPSVRAIGTGATEACAGNDARLSDARAPLTHSHTASQVTDFTEVAQDLVAAMLKDGTGIQCIYDDTAGTLTINCTLSGGASSAIYGSSSPNAIITPPGTNGYLAVRQNGGVAGTDEVRTWHDGTAGHVASMDGNLRLRNGAVLDGSIQFQDAAGNTRGSVSMAAAVAIFEGGYQVGGTSCGLFGAGLDLYGAQLIQWRDGSYGTPDVALVRVAGGGFAVTNGSTGGGFFQSKAMSDPGVAAADCGRTFWRKNGSGKMEFCARFPTGAVQVIATEP